MTYSRVEGVELPQLKFYHPTLGILELLLVYLNEVPDNDILDLLDFNHQVDQKASGTSGAVSQVGATVAVKAVNHERGYSPTPSDHATCSSVILASRNLPRCEFRSESANECVWKMWSLVLICKAQFTKRLKIRPPFTWKILAAHQDQHVNK